jgi:two-component system, OmpR family, sensor kinase
MFRFLRRTPLRVKLVATVFVLTAVALTVIGVASSLAVRSALLSRVDNQITAPVDWRRVPIEPMTSYIPPTNYIVGIKDVYGHGTLFPQYLTAGELPKLPVGAANVAKVSGKPYTVKSVDGKHLWRMNITILPNGELGVVGQNLDDIRGSEDELVSRTLLICGLTLFAVTLIGAALVRANLRPLSRIEETAAKIAGGNLGERVPEFEPGPQPPRTEVGHLARSLNVMLGQIEAAFQARSASESAAQEAAAAAQESEARALASEERMRRFAADASHELRTPLTTIRGFAELYRQGAARAPEETARLMRRIEDEASRMGLLVQDMLLLARLDQERPLDSMPVDLRIIAADAVVNAKAMDPDRPIELEIGSGSGPLVVRGDELRLRQVVTNLMANALRYTPAASPVTLRLRAADRSGFAELAVIDHGPGLTDEQAGRVFERFYRTDSARTRRAGDGERGSSGTGLGLAIVAALVKAHGGTVEVQKTPGSGATFVVVLPLIPETVSSDISVMP